MHDLHEPLGSPALPPAADLHGSDRPAFPNGCCSYNTLAEGVRARTADPSDYEAVLDSVLDRAVARGSLAHVFIDPPDAGYGRLPGDTKDYAGAVERWLARAVVRPDLAIMTTAELATWWLAREAAVQHMQVRRLGKEVKVRIDDAPAGTTIGLYTPTSGWTYELLEPETA